ncbi:hypothetical protein RN346_03395 [Halomonas sp. PAMB 3232]|uniref:HEPN domain-containing protein n=1 Tax=Halomonas sp. PAMB 3232 TaxID=3075221 RepID=UPI00289CD563|nr:HEPN domain-containing protein [Halomonas sp. PAMB 3232]WNL39611.1 hypothetical protein RN346_03395 [Halomonas sp. PAMB 3232]
MTTRLLRTRLAVDNCRSHLEESNSWGTEIEAYLTQHILVIMCAEIQQELYLILENRAEEASDEELKAFAVATGKKVLRSVGKTEIANFVGNFGSSAKNHLNSNLDDREVTLYSNAISNRHDVAHSSGSNITFRELENILTPASKLIDAVERAISTAREAA